MRNIGTRSSVLPLLLLALAGCASRNVDTTYGKVHSPSVNGTGTLAEMFREDGHEVRSAVRLTEELRGWADLIVRFAPQPGPPAKDEAAWYDEWLDAAPGRRLVYVPRDYSANEEYWSRALDGLPKDAAPRLRERIEEARKEESGWTSKLPPKAKEVAGADDWFAVEGSSGGATVCKTLTGPWAKGVDAARANLTRHETLKVKYENVLLEGDGKPLVIAWHRTNGSDVLIPASGTFLLNLPLVEPARWPLAKRTLDWAEDRQEGSPRPPRRLKVAFVEGRYVLFDREATPSVFALLNVSPFGRVAAQLFALGLVACLAMAPRLGRPRPSEPSGADRPVAHPEALGALLARTGQSGEARSILETYRRWRHGHTGHAGRDLGAKAFDK